MVLAAELGISNPIVKAPILQIVPRHELDDEAYRQNKLVNKIFELAEGLTYSQQFEVTKLAGKAMVGEIVDFCVVNFVRNGQRIRTVYQIPKMAHEMNLTPFFYSDRMHFRDESGQVVNEYGIPAEKGQLDSLGNEIEHRLLTAEMVEFELC